MSTKLVTSKPVLQTNSSSLHANGAVASNQIRASMGSTQIRMTEAQRRQSNSGISNKYLTKNINQQSVIAARSQSGNSGVS